MSDALANGQKLRGLTVVDAFSRERRALDGDVQFRGADVARVLTRLEITRGLPEVIQCDNGTEFTSRALDQWAWAHGMQLDFSRPGKPTDNATIESLTPAFGVSVSRSITFRLSSRLRSYSGSSATSITTTDRTAA